MTCTPMNPDWRFVSDVVMGGVSDGEVTWQDDADAGRSARLTGQVSLENNGGFIQMAFSPGGDDVFDAQGFAGLAFDVRGNGQDYDLSLRTTDLNRPWQSYRAAFATSDRWSTVRLLWPAFAPNRTEKPFDPAKLRRIGVISVGRAMAVEVDVANFCLIG